MQYIAILRWRPRGRLGMFGFFCSCGYLLSKASGVQVTGIRRSYICCWRGFEGESGDSVGDVKNFH